MQSEKMGNGSPENEFNENEQMLPHEESEKPRWKNKRCFLRCRYENDFFAFFE